jgi:iron-sulfur cluster repair protein YtfE (RIC family)
MNETAELLDQLIAEHKALGEKAQAVVTAANDAGILVDLKKAETTFTVGQPNPSQSLKNLDEMLKSINDWLVKHFNREETILLAAVKTLNNEKQTLALEACLFEHTDLRDRLYHSKKRVAELFNGGLAPNLWEATARDIRAYLSHTINLLMTHARNENKLFTNLRQQLKKS